MGPFAVQLLLESFLVPFLLAGSLVLGTRAYPWDRAGTVALPLAVILAVGTTFVLAFGWPANLVLSARMKIMLAAVISFAISLAIESRGRWSKVAFTAGVIGLPVWVGLPALQQGRLESLLLILPIGTGLAAPLLVDKDTPSGKTSLLLMILTAALGLAAIAAFARALSFTELGLALASAVLAILLFWRFPPSSPTLFTSAATVLALATALLLYSDASLPALMVLGTIIGAGRLAHITYQGTSSSTPTLRVLFFCFLPTALAILIARIDAGSISLY